MPARQLGPAPNSVSETSRVREPEAAVEPVRVHNGEPVDPAADESKTRLLSLRDASPFGVRPFCLFEPMARTNNHGVAKGEAGS